MDPMNFRNISTGIGAIKIIAYSEWVAFKRNKGLLLSMGMGPVLSYGLLVLALSTSLKTVNLEGVAILYKQYALTGVLTFFVTRQMSQAMYRATIDKEYGLLALKFLNGIQPWYYLIGMSCFPIVGLLFQCSILFILGMMSGGIYNIGFFLLSIIVVIISLGFWSALGILLSTKISTYEKRDIVMTLIFSPVSYAAPTLYVFSDKLPLFVKCLIMINPLTYQLKAIRTVAFGFFEPLPILVDLLLTLGMMYLAQRILRKVSLQLSIR
ncbi:ABC transporter permease [uncultured Ligilactobacillus sp.]|uniref:ABC transporter permease n=1 Tax=uncultured Ligilactobacillus sp. TaxID=2837633 RepID=UPI00272BE281|nr:ABC transporter permease [uncultured Ligilactobacillus sp.]